MSGLSAVFWMIPDKFPPNSGRKHKKVGIMKEAGVREHQRLKDAQRGCELYFLEGLG